MKKIKFDILHYVIICGSSLIPLLACTAILFYLQNKSIDEHNTEISKHFIRMFDDLLLEALTSSVEIDTIASYENQTKNIHTTSQNLICSPELLRKIKLLPKSKKYIAHVSVVNSKQEIICGSIYEDVKLSPPAINIGSNNTKITPLVTIFQDKIIFLINTQLRENIYSAVYVVVDKRFFSDLPYPLLAIKEMYLTNLKGEKYFQDDKFNYIIKNYSNYETLNSKIYNIVSKNFNYGLKITYENKKITEIYTNYIIFVIFLAFMCSFFIYIILNNFLIKNKQNINSYKYDTEIRNAVEEQQLIPYYQPIVSLDSGEILGCEVLMRWQKPNGRIIMPLSFIDRLDNDEFAGVATQQIMQKALFELEEVYNNNKDFLISFNLFSIQFKNFKIKDDLQLVFSNTKIPIKNIILEITEHKVLPNIKIASEIVDELRRVGFKIALDDVGIGQSNLLSLQSLPIDILKIDRQFVEKISVTGQSPIIAGLIEIAKVMNIKVIAEGIETQHQFSYLRNLKIFAGQGFAISPAIPINDFLKFLKHLKEF